MDYRPRLKLVESYTSIAEVQMNRDHPSWLKQAHLQLLRADDLRLKGYIRKEPAMVYEIEFVGVVAEKLLTEPWWRVGV